METRICTKCLQEKSFEEFYKDAKASGGRSRACKECVKSRLKEYYKDNSNKIQESVKRYNRENVKLVRLRHKKYADAHKSQIAAYQKEYRETNKVALREKVKARYHKDPSGFKARTDRYKKSKPDAFYETKRKWQRNNPEKIRDKVERRRARKLGVVSNLTQAQWEWLLQECEYKCLSCNLTINELLSIGRGMTQDHIVPLNPGADTLDNVQPLCSFCNPSKGRKTIDYRPQWLKEKISIYLNA